MSEHDYNYAVFEMSRETPKWVAFQNNPPHAGGEAPSFPLEDLDSGATVAMQDLWKEGLALIEFGSYT